MYVAKYNIEFNMIYNIYLLAHFLAFKNIQSRMLKRQLSVDFRYSILKTKLYIILQREKEHEISVILRGASNQIKWCLAIRSLLQISS